MPIRTTRPTADSCGAYYFTYINQVPDGDIVISLAAQQHVLHDLLHAVTDAYAATSPAPGEWSIKQVVQHLIDAERLFAFRALWFARGEQTALPGMEPDPWVACTASNSRSLQSLLDEFGHVRAATLALFQHLDETAWQRQGIASGMPMSVHALAWIIAGHELHHIRSLREVYL